MKSTALDKKRLLQLVTQIRQLAEITPVQRLAAIETILSELDILRRRDTEVLMCAKCARKQRQYFDHASLYRLAERGRIRVHKVCCKSFYSREEITSLPPKPQPGGVKKVRVGMKEMKANT